ncbi:hypothetical protein D0T49_00575 [Paludibacter sp. 221]|uniref:hypothetical protein n=1 Tax=Paludibacter sp. 221 TaxID=2302939 RepID=UPI0013D73543|nr:hypothetical protein [Paludibacter sp. 221]NDV45547.1 hypothetical protein [Paludibacter sp. 221]
MKKTVFILITLICFACSSQKDISTLDRNMRKVSVGMSKKKVVSKLGKDYEIIKMGTGAYVIGYKAADNGIYKLTFVDGALVELEKDTNNGKIIHIINKAE